MSQQNGTVKRVSSTVKVSPRSGCSSAKWPWILALTVIVLVVAIAAVVVVVTTGNDSDGPSPAADQQTCSSLACSTDYVAAASSADTPCKLLACSAENDLDVCCTYVGGDVAVVQVANVLAGIDVAGFAAVEPFYVETQARVLRVQTDQITNVEAREASSRRRRALLRKQFMGRGLEATGVDVTFDVNVPTVRVAVLEERVADTEEYNEEIIVDVLSTVLVENNSTSNVTDSIAVVIERIPIVASVSTTPTASVTPTISDSTSPSPSPTPSPSSSPTVSPTSSSTPSTSGSPQPSGSTSPAPSTSPSASASPSTSPSASESRPASASGSPSTTGSTSTSPSKSPSPSSSSSSSPSASPSATPSPPPEFERVVSPVVDGNATVVSAGVFEALQYSDPDTLYLLGRVEVLSGVTRTVYAAQSMDGLPWEPAQPLKLFNITCDRVIHGVDACVVGIPDDDHVWEVRAMSAPTASQEERAARFLLASTFGPSKADVDAFMAGGFQFEDRARAWVDTQKRLPPTLHRANYRRRVNPDVDGPWAIAGVREPCEVQSRWSLVAEPADTSSGVVVVAQTLDLVDLEPAVEGAKLLATRLSPCDVNYTQTIFGQDEAGQTYTYEKRMRLITNTLEQVALGTNGATVCTTVTKNLFNEASCVIGASPCASLSISDSTPIPVNETLLELLYNQTGTIAYAITNLQMDGVSPPCESEVSRWARVDGSCTGAVNSSFIQTAVQDATAALESKVVVDLRTKRAECGDLAVGTMVSVQVGGVSTCWKHTHPEEYDVYDFTEWGRRLHPGNSLFAPEDNPIQSPRVKRRESVLRFPGSHPMDRWTRSRERFPLIGVWQSTISFPDLPSNVQSLDLAAALGVLTAPISGSDAAGYELCGSPGEVANNPAKGNRYRFRGATPEQMFDQRKPFALYTRSSVWFNAVLPAADQLRQRVAWALLQTLVISAGDTEGSTGESYTVYTDIMVRNAFGNFRDILREVSYSPLMGRMLTFAGSASVFQSLINPGRLLFPDENFPREICQLFTIGLWKLHMNGTYVLDANNDRVPTYVQDDILEYARAWTGFQYSPSRGNREAVNSRNYVDPMYLIIHKRDWYPKRGLNGKYVGDGLPLCWDLPHQHFLQQGAEYRYTVTAHDPWLLEELGSGSADSDWRRLRLDNSSALYMELCRPAADGSGCRPQTLVRLPADIECTGLECDIEEPRVVEVVDPTGQSYFFEFTRPPCAAHTFYGTGKPLTSRWNQHAVCVDDRLVAGSVPCCNSAGSVQSEPFLYSGEFTTFATGAARCAAAGLNTCPASFTGFASGDLESDQRDTYLHWADSPCSVQVQVFRDGSVTLVHSMPDEKNEAEKNSKIKADSLVTFRVLWEADTFPTIEDACGGVGSNCTVHEDSCLCDTDEATTPVVSSASGFHNASAAWLLSRLHIGSPRPDQLTTTNTSTYVQCSTAACGPQTEFTVYVDNAMDVVNDATIIVIDDPHVTGTTRYLRNIESMVAVSSGSFRFRNPPSIMSLHRPSTGEAMLETEAVLDTYFEHPNMAPFLAKALISKLTSSNPTPGYVERVATAFRDGVFEGQGSGKYGDLAAAASAVVLDREAVSLSMEVNPVHGQIREPVVKILHAMRSLALEPHEGVALEMKGLLDKVGVSPYDSPTVFNFFQPEYSPNGPLGSMGLVGPEAQVLTAPTVTAFMNGILSLNLFGLIDCDQGFSYRRDTAVSCGDLRAGRREPSEAWAGGWTYANLNRSDTSGFLDDLGLLLTGGRLHPVTKQFLSDAQAQLAETVGSDLATSIAMQLLLSSAEFHQTGRHVPMLPPAATTDDAEEEESESEEEGSASTSDTPYRAVVYVFLFGGADTYNLLVPRSECDIDMYQHYQDVRDIIALQPEELIDIDVPTGTQVCERFGIIQELSTVASLYNDGDAAFVANVGPLVEPIANKEEYVYKAKPPQLFAHNIQQKVSMDGVLGRMRDTMEARGVSTGSYSLTGTSDALVAVEPYDVVTASSGVIPFDSKDQMSEADPYLDALLANSSSSLYADTWLQLARSGVQRSAMLDTVISTATVATSFPTQSSSDGSRIGQQLHRVAQLINQRSQLGDESAVFHLNVGGFDTHSIGNSVLQEKMAALDAGLADFVAEMKAQGLWNNVTIMVASEFARTLSSNGVGTDHGWGGHSLILGGGIKGGQVFGEYPALLNDSSPLSLGRGRMIPTTSWESIYAPMGEWFGVPSEDLDSVLPNRQNFGADALYSVAELYEE